jgi:hypothetical protein
MFQDSLIEFLLDNTAECTTEMTTPNSSTSFFSTFREVVFSANVKYPRTPGCPFFFKNFRTESLVMKAQINSFVNTNLFRFESLPSNETTINSSVGMLLINGYHYDVDEDLQVNPLVFETMQSISIEGNIGSLQESLFRSFEYLTRVAT